MRVLLLGLVLYSLVANGQCPSRLEAEEKKKETIGFLTTGKEVCSGTLLSRHVVLTAAHCVERLKAEDLSFTLSPDLMEGGRGPFVKVAEIRIYPKFSRGQPKRYGGGDLALLRLTNDAYGTSPRVFYSVIDSPVDLSLGATAFLIGYGIGKETGAGLRRLRRVRFAKSMDAVLSDGTRVPGGVLQFFRGDEGELPCGGDSGSPVLKFIAGKTSMIALHSASWALVRQLRTGLKEKKSQRQICRISSETFDTALFPFREWIERNWRQMETDKPLVPCP